MPRWWRTGLAVAAALLTVTAGAVPVGAAAPTVTIPDLRATGSYPTQVRTYDFGDTALGKPTVSGPTELRGVVHAPADPAGKAFPLVVLLHGKADTCGNAQKAMYAWPCPSGTTPIESHRGYDYLAADLATHGYVVVSISANGINASDDGLNDFGTAARSALIGRHLTLWRQWSTVGGDPFGTDFVGAVNPQRVGLMGHSRGGEGAVAYAADHPGTVDGFRIAAVSALAPTDLTRRTVTGVPLEVVLPLCDFEVDDLQGVHYIDDARYAAPADTAPKHLVTVAGANHAFFNTVWSPSGGAPGAHDDASWTSPGATCQKDGPGRLTEQQQRLSGLAAVNGFFRHYLGNDQALRPLWTGETPVPDWAGEVSISRHPGTDRRTVVNPLAAAAGLTANPLGGTVTTTGPLTTRICARLQGNPRVACLTGNRPLARISEPHANANVGPATSMVKVAWTGAGATLVNTVPAGSGDIAGFKGLQFRAALDYSDTLNAAGITQNLSVVLTDAAGRSARVAVGDHTRTLAFPALAPTTVQWDSGPHFVLRQVRVPLCAFTGVDLTNVRSITLAFDGPSTGSLGLSDLMVTD
jgi:dienelactone hydrolase